MSSRAAAWIFSGSQSQKSKESPNAAMYPVTSWGSSSAATALIVPAARTGRGCTGNVTVTACQRGEMCACPSQYSCFQPSLRGLRSKASLLMGMCWLRMVLPSLGKLETPQRDVSTQHSVLLTPSETRTIARYCRAPSCASRSQGWRRSSRQLFCARRAIRLRCAGSPSPT